MYLFTRLNNILAVTAILGFVSLIFAFTYFVNWHCALEYSKPNTDEIKSSKKRFKIALVPVVICALILMLVPSQKEMAAIYVVPKVVNNEQIQTITKDGLSAVSKLVELSNKYLVGLEDKQKVEEEK